MESSAVKKGMDLKEEIERLFLLSEALKKAEGPHEKIEVLNRDSRVEAFFKGSYSYWIKDLERSKELELVIKSVIAIGQGELVFNASLEGMEQRREELFDLLTQLETFYRDIGGIIGYQLTLLEFLEQPKQRFSVDRSTYHAPQMVDLSKDSYELREMVYYAIDKMPFLAEMYPVGGAADRLRLHDPETGTPVPAATLSFNGKTLLGKLIEDLQAREYLYYKVKGNNITIPVAMMTSQEKENHSQVLALCEKNNWFGRSKESFSFFCQPLVPVVSRSGNWILTEPMKLLMKPGGHGVIWKLARDKGVIEWLINKGAVKAIIRQINNPVSSEDSHLLAFSGYGFKEDRKFGFASCERQVKSSEGINVVVEEEKADGFSYTLTNIEYCDFKAYGIQDEPRASGERFSKFPSNTNLLFIDLHSIGSAVEKCPLPGVLVNVKKVAIGKEKGKVIEKEIARLEAAMQNIADAFSTKSPHRLEEKEMKSLDAYITFNKRQKTISATKKEFSLGTSLLETPEGCFLDVMANGRDLLKSTCGFILPPLHKPADSFVNPSFLFYYHPALGPIYSVIAQKLRGGEIKKQAELRLQIAECDIEMLTVEGSLLIEAEQVMGSFEKEGILRYSEETGRCTLKNVSIHNKGIDYEKENIFWKPQIARKESCHIVLKGSSEFCAEDISLEGNLKIIVEDGWKVTAKKEGGKLVLQKERLEGPSWRWQYRFNEEKALQIEKV